VTSKKSKTGAEARSRVISKEATLGVHAEIGRKLKQYYDELISHEVPDRFSQLLSKLEKAEPAQKKD
jgi:hypothetical protein